MKLVTVAGTSLLFQQYKMRALLKQQFNQVSQCVRFMLPEEFRRPTKPLRTT